MDYLLAKGPAYINNLKRNRMGLHVSFEKHFWLDLRLHMIETHFSAWIPIDQKWKPRRDDSFFWYSNTASRLLRHELCKSPDGFVDFEVFYNQVRLEHEKNSICVVKDHLRAAGTKDGVSASKAKIAPPSTH